MRWYRSMLRRDPLTTTPDSRLTPWDSGVGARLGESLPPFAGHSRVFVNHWRVVEILTTR